jgi:serine phosphatase RsbU (regulator of sigma subunit)/Tfp pilus assembly protein PilF
MKFVRILFLFLFLTSLVKAQTAKIDSLLVVLKNAKSDTAKVNTYNSLALLYFKINDFKNSNFYFEKALQFAKDINYSKGLADAWSIGGVLDDSKSDFDAAIEKYDKAIELYEVSTDKLKIAQVLQDKANAFYSKGVNDKALKFYLGSLKLREQMDDSSAIASSYMGISNVYSQMHRSELALPYAKKALRLKEKYGDEKSVSWLLNNVGVFLLEMGDTAGALPYYYKSIELKKRLGDEYGLATTYKNIGSINLRSKKYASALGYYRKSLEMRSRINPDDGVEMSSCYDDIGSVYSDMKIYDSAEFYVAKAIALGEKVHSFEALRLPYYNMSLVLYREGKYQAAIEFLQKHIAAKDSTLSIETNALITEMAAKYDNEKKEQQIALQELEINDQKKSKTFLISLSFLAIMLTVVMLRGYLSKRKANGLLAEKNNLIEQQKQIVELKNKDITDSIYYAQRIQNAILPSVDYQNKLIPGSFTFFKPKDIVSGDFYWMEQWGNKKIIAIVDCTGHGVPGAFMTFVAYSLLNEAVLEHGIDNPSAILNEMRRNLNKMLRQKNESEIIRDGMDISICVFDFSKKIVEYAGAYNPLWLIRDNELREIKADKQPVGIFTDSQPASFTNHVIEMKKDDVFYLFTDGFADQFGGDKGKKFKYKTLKQLLISIHDNEPAVQKKMLNDAFENWRGKLEQVDDVCVFGVRIPID